MKRQPSAVIRSLARVRKLIEEELNGRHGRAVGNGVVNGETLHIITYLRRLGVMSEKSFHNFWARTIHARDVERGTMIGCLRDVDGLGKGAEQLVHNNLGRIHGNGMMQREGLGLFERVVESVAVGSLANFVGMRFDALLDAVPGAFVNELVQCARRKHDDFGL